MKLKEIVIPAVPNRQGQEFDKALKQRFENPAPLKLPVYTFQQLKEVSPEMYPNCMVVCSNGDAGVECLAYSNGRAWFVVTIGNRITIS